MKITRDVILDLLPLYAADEASEASRALVDEYLDEQPDLRQVVEAMTRYVPSRAEFAPPSEEAKARGFVRARRLVALRGLLLGAAIASTAGIFSVWNVGEGVQWLLRDHPAIAAQVATVAALLWFAYFLFRRRLEGLGL